MSVQEKVKTEETDVKRKREKQKIILKEWKFYLFQYFGEDLTCARHSFLRRFC